MIKVHSKALDQTIEIDRYIGEIKGDAKGPSVILFAGIHGNEPAGVFALHQAFHEITELRLQVNGNIYGLAGNLWALEKGKRYQKEDLNRLWTEGRVKAIEKNNLAADNEDTAQQLEILDQIKTILERDEGPFYFMDLHTTSSQTIPFLTVNDSLLNRKFAEQYPNPMILGIEEYLNGPLLSYINEMGFVSFGFEGGQHDDKASIIHHKAFVYLSLVFANILSKEEIDYEYHYQLLNLANQSITGVYEIYYRYQIKPSEKFIMKAGYQNFQYIKKGELLAMSNNEEVLAEYSSRIFMPLYQNQGDDGFFAIRPIPSFFLKVSELFRRWKLDRILPYLPGVNWATSRRDSLLLKKRIAKFLAKELMHLMGYRSRLFDKEYILVKNREAASKHAQYAGEQWYLERFIHKK